MNLRRGDEEDTKMAREVDDQVSPEDVIGLPVGSLAAKALEFGPHFVVVFPVFAQLF